MRAFLAIELPEAVRARLAALQRDLASAKADVKWVDPNHLHVTMRFLGEIAEPQRQAVAVLIERVAGATAPMRLQLVELGAFPSPSAPRVLWVGIQEGREALE